MITNPIGVLALSRREIWRFLTVASQTIFPPIMTSALFLYIFGIALGKRIIFDTNGLSYLEFIIPGLMTMHLISSSFENTSSSLFIARWHNHIQEVLLAPLSYFEMVLGLLAGGVVRGALVCACVFMISKIFIHIDIYHIYLLIYFILMISVIFSCAGMMAALWAEDFGMLNMWNVYFIVPLVLMGGVFHPISMLPKIVQDISKFNPMFYLVNGIRFSITGVSDVTIIPCMAISLLLALMSFFFTVYLFKVGYKLRT